jgi:hypothetical protein
LSPIDIAMKLRSQQFAFRQGPNYEYCGTRRRLGRVALHARGVRRFQLKRFLDHKYQ